jgi:hypothetical protein
MSASEGKVAQVMYLASADKYLLRYCEDDEGYEDCTIQIHGLSGRSSRWDLGVNTHLGGFAVSLKTSRLYVAHERESDGVFELKEFDMERREETRILFSTKLDFNWLTVSPSGDRLLFVLDSDSIQMIQLDGAYRQPRAVVRNANDLYLPVWVDSDRFVYFREGEYDFAELVLFSLDDGRKRILHKFASLMDPPSISRDRSRILITALTEEPGGNFDPDVYSNWQLVEVDIASGATKILTDEPLGAGLGAYNPASNSVAYYSPPDMDEAQTARILDLDTQEVQVVWTDEEERLIATAERQAKDGRNAMALTTYRDLLNRFPESRLKNIALYGVALLHLEPPFFNLDKAHAAIQNISEEYIRWSALPLFWRAEDIVASDPPGDLMQSYSAEEQAALAFKFDPNPAMDLRGLSARWSDTRLYLKIDFASPTDMKLMKGKDLLFLFSRTEAGQGSFPLVSDLLWDHPVDRQVLLRHWALGSRCDFEIRDGAGDIWSSFVGVGRFEFAYTSFEVIDSYIGGKDSSIAVALSRAHDGLDLRGNGPFYVQVATVKPSNNLGQMNTFADAFGLDNTPDATQPNMVRGYAAALNPDDEP